MLRTPKNKGRQLIQAALGSKVPFQALTVEDLANAAQ